ncbi:MAG: sigma-54-dependent Fis family transcriptional regulator, partial [Planctomycetales bacterium]|nr:sigma-54-dependent Fis family transcriptional regulator [Planctomycetales bacterium]
DVDMLLLDVRLPGMSGIDALRPIRELNSSITILLITAYAEVKQAVEAMKRGANDYLVKPIDLDELAAVIQDALGTESCPANAVSGSHSSGSESLALPGDIVCVSPAMCKLMETVRIVAPSDAPILITGESGVGKEVVARLLHHWSPRRSGPLVTANCAGLPETLVESELFGHLKGAFTGANAARLGYFRSADTGTLFLDEIGDLPLHLQPKLLRALESGEVAPIGSDQPVTVDIRLIAATNRDVQVQVQQGTFREDLYFRIGVVELWVPPLRDRREDIVPLAKQFASQFAGGPIRLSPQAMQAILVYDWSGNVRQLRNAMQRACLLSRGDVILPEHLPQQVIANRSTDGTTPSDEGRLSQVERATILATLAECNGNRTQAAQKLGISRRALIYKLRAME